MQRLLVLIAVVLAAAPAGVAAGLGWWIHPGLGVAAGSLLYGLLAVGVLFADVLPDREPSR